ncbi:SDR family oxidoreductase [bacterium]|nr:SDR family oxidoreductase [bacterium]MBU1638086.1 SDR family oxidoreductase [bacterium]
MASSKYLVTGGAGFIGSNLVEALLLLGHRVAVLDNFSTGRRENLAAFLNDIELHEGDLRDASAVAKAVKGCDFILHQGALPSVPRSVADPMASNEVNVTGTLNILMAARNAGVQRVVAASSSSVYGNTPTLPKVETMPVLPMSPYAVSKLATEKYLAAFYHVYGLETVALRYFNIFGPRQDPASQYSAVIPKFITAIRKGEQPIMHGDGLQSRDFTYVDNAVEANLLACHAEGAAGEFFNIACGDRFTLLHTLDGINQQLNTAVEPVHEPSRPGDVKHSLADISKAKKILGYSVVTPFNKGLEKTVAYFTRMNA